MPRGAQPGERRGGRAKGTPNKTPLQKAEALAAKVAKAEARAAVKVAVEPLEHKLAKEVLDWGMQYCVARAAFRRPALADEPPNPNEDGGDFLKWLALAAEFAKTLASYQSPRLLAHAIKAPTTENCAAPGTNAKERLSFGDCVYFVPAGQGVVRNQPPHPELAKRAGITQPPAPPLPRCGGGFPLWNQSPRFGICFSCGRTPSHCPSAP